MNGRTPITIFLEGLPKSKSTKPEIKETKTKKAA